MVQRALSLLFLIAVVCVNSAHARAQVSSEPWSSVGSDYHLTYHDRADSQVVTFYGMFPKRFGADLRQLQETLISGKPIDLVVSVSMGGFVSSYRQIASTLRAACPKGSCRITTYVDEICASACIDLFMLGDLRLISPRAIFGFHRAFQSFGPFERVTQTKQQFIQTYADLGANLCWLEDNADQLTANQKMAVWVSADDLLEGHFAERIDSDESFLEGLKAVLPNEFSVRHTLVDRPQMLQSAYRR